MEAKAGATTFRIRSSEIDLRGQATLPALVSYMQEAAWENTASLGISMYDLLEQGLTWVLQRLRLEMLRYPQHRERIRVETWASGYERVFLYRDFRFYSEDGSLLGQATSVWLVMDVVRRRLVAVPGFVKALAEVPDQEPLPFARGKLPQLPEALYGMQVPVRWHDIDLNRHVTNTRYLQWALDTLPHEVLGQNQLQGLDIIFKAESMLGDTVIAQAGAGATAGTMLHTLTSRDTGKELVQAQTKWKNELPALE